ncbi:MAG: endonuclease/exonuclease/phosphatase family metal-dependent hydrolase [Flavobacteriales bacterium]|jgi:endonuclease/exonuclease/phosphatase family metal-dependent hydrolase
MKLFLTFATALMCTLVFGQTEINITCYNVLNFPTGSMLNRQDTLKKILNYTQPDLLLLQELKSEEGLTSIAEQSCADLDGNYVSSTWISQQSNQNSDWQLQQAIVYNNDVFGLDEERLKTTDVRDINIYKLFLRDIELQNGADTTFIYVFVTHLKSSSGSDNEAARLQMAEVFVNALTEIDPNSYCIFGGDFNVYSSSEPAYQLLLNAENSIVFEDPIDAPGNWTSSTYPFKEILTQSTRTSQIFGDGAGGGLDDRFDFILASENLMDQNEPLHYQSDSYLALANNGTCYNQNITDCEEDNEVPMEIIQALYYMSDHLPVLMKLETQIELAINNEITFDPNLNVFSDGKSLFLFDESAQQSIFMVDLFDVTGKRVKSVQMSSGAHIVLNDFTAGIYVAQVRKGNELVKVAKFIRN